MSFNKLELPKLLLNFGSLKSVQLLDVALLAENLLKIAKLNCEEIQNWFTQEKLNHFSDKNPVKEVTIGNEFGTHIYKFDDIEIGDELKSFIEVEIDN